MLKINAIDFIMISLIVGGLAGTELTFAQDRVPGKVAERDIYALAPTNVLASALRAERLAAERLVWTADLRARRDRVLEMLEYDKSSHGANDILDGVGDATVGSLETNVYAIIPLFHHTNITARQWAITYIGWHSLGARSLTMTASLPKDAPIRKWGRGPAWCNEVANPLMERSFFDSEKMVRIMALYLYGSESNPGSTVRISELAATQGTNQIAIELWTHVYFRSTNMVPTNIISIVQADLFQKRVREAKVYFSTGIGDWIPRDIMMELNKLFDADMAAMGIPQEEFETCRHYAIRSARLDNDHAVPPISPEEEAKMKAFIKAWKAFKSKNTVNIP